VQTGFGDAIGASVVALGKAGGVHSVVILILLLLLAIASVRTPPTDVSLPAPRPQTHWAEKAIAVLAGMVLLTGNLTAQERVHAAVILSQPKIQAQTACETEMLRGMDAHEVFSGKGYDVLSEVARAYGRAVPHIYISPGALNSVYIAGSTAVDGRGKIVVGQQAIERFDAFSLKGFLGHEIAHLVGDNAAQGCNDYIVRDPQMEADADALAARTLGTGPVKAFLQRVLAVTQGQNWDARQRLQRLQ
jgi:Zn-dependent protease with chaperone function